MIELAAVRRPRASRVRPARINVRGIGEVSSEPKLTLPFRLRSSFAPDADDGEQSAGVADVDAGGRAKLQVVGIRNHVQHPFAV